MRLRFSLRTLFVLAAIVVIFCYWLVRPSIIATHFAEAAEELDFTTANDLIDDHRHLFADWNDRNLAIQVAVTLRPWNFSQLFRGQRHVGIEITYLGLTNQQISKSINATATPFGLRSTPM